MTFKIDDVDFTTCVVHKTYEINQEKEYIEWQNANFRTVRKEVCRKVKGKVKLHIRDAEFLEKFRRVYNTEHNDSLYNVLCSVNNTGRTEYFRAYISCLPVRHSVGMFDTLEEFDLLIEEA